MFPEGSKPIEIAKLASSLLPQVSADLSILERLNEATEMACNLLRLSEEALENARVQSHESYKTAIETIYARPLSELENLSLEEVTEIEAIRQRFLQIARGNTLLNDEEFLKTVLLPGRNHQLKTLRTAWLGFEAKVGHSLQLDITTAVQYGPKFIQDCSERLSTHLKRGKTEAAKKAGKKGGMAKAKIEKKRHGPGT